MLIKNNIMTTFVLVHGAWHGGWCWKYVRQYLELSGHQVFTPTMTGVGERSHLLSREITLDTCCQDIAAVLHYEDLHNVVLVGHSFGGSIISGVAELEPNRIQRLVYLDSDILENGESPFSSLPREAVEERKRSAQETSGGVSFPPPDPELLGVFDAKQRAWLLRNLTPHPLSTYESPLHLKQLPGKGFPCTYVVCVDPAYPAMQSKVRQRVVRYGWHVREIATGHDLMISAPKETAQVLMDIAASADT